MQEPKTIKNVLKGNRLAPQKSLGQNFLINVRIAEKIVEEAKVTLSDTVVELGVGFGSLTIPLAAKAGKVIGLEIDAGIIKWHAEQHLLPANVLLSHQDLLQADFKRLAKEIGQPLKIIANLPYSISSPLLFKLLDNADIIDWAVLMLQKEVADRLTAAKNTKQYGILTVLFAPFAVVERLFLVGPGNFHPKPKVDSTVIRLRFHVPRQTKLTPDQWPIFKELVKSAFQQRRKTLLNALSGSALFPGGKVQIRALLREAGIGERSRAEDLSATDYMELVGRLCRQADFEAKIS